MPVSLVSYVATLLIDIVKIPSGMTSWKCFICIFSWQALVFCCRNTQTIYRFAIRQWTVSSQSIFRCANLLYLCHAPLTFRCHQCLVIRWNIIVEHRAGEWSFSNDWAPDETFRSCCYSFFYTVCLSFYPFRVIPSPAYCSTTFHVGSAYIHTHNPAMVCVDVIFIEYSEWNVKKNKITNCKNTNSNWN